MQGGGSEQSSAIEFGVRDRIFLDCRASRHCLCRLSNILPSIRPVCLPISRPGPLDRLRLVEVRRDVTSCFFEMLFHRFIAGFFQELMVDLVLH